MPKKLSRRGGVAILGTAEATVRIYTVQRSNGYPQFRVAWHEAGERKIKAFANKDAAHLFAQQTVVQLQNGAATSEAATILRPYFQRAREALATEYARHYEIAEPVLSNKKNNPTVKECVRWMDAADTIGPRIHRASNANHEYGPQSLLEGWVIIHTRSPE
ncbi:MAG: hypothetical protein ACFCU4_00390 [Puniceicoccaceae bacterium]